jgi:hypothetical protein
MDFLKAASAAPAHHIEVAVAPDGLRLAVLRLQLGSAGAALPPHTPMGAP